MANALSILSKKPYTTQLTLCYGQRQRSLHLTSLKKQDYHYTVYDFIYFVYPFFWPSYCFPLASFCLSFPDTTSHACEKSSGNQFNIKQESRPNLNSDLE